MILSAYGHPRHARTGRAAAHRPPAGTRARTADRGRSRRPKARPSASPRRCATPAGSSCATTAGDGDPLASGVEAAIIADALGEAVADVAFAGPVLAADLARRAGARPIDGAVVAFSPDLIDAAVVSGPTTDTPLLAVDGAAQGPVAAYVLVPEGDGYRLALVPVDGRARRRRPHARDPTAPGRLALQPGSRPVAAAHARRPRRRGRRSAWRSRAPTWSGSCAACSTSRSPTRRSAGSTASPSERSRPCSTSSPRRAA